MMISNMLQAFTTRFAMASVGAMALTLGIAGEGKAVSFTLTGEASGIDSGFDTILGDLNSAQDVQDALTEINALDPTRNVELGGNNFFSFEFESEDPTAFVESIVLDLRAGDDPDAAFDNQEALGLVNSNPQAVGGGPGTVAPSNILFDPADVGRNDFSNPNPTSVLTINFLNQAFTTGNVARFGVDTNAVGEDDIPLLDLLNGFTSDDTSSFNDPGGDFAAAGVSFLATIIKGGETFTESATFKPDPTRPRFASIATIENSPAPVLAPPPDVTDVPEPFTILGSAAALGYGLRLKRKRDRQKTAMA